MSAEMRKPSLPNVIGMRDEAAFGIEFIPQEVGESSI